MDHSDHMHHMHVGHGGMDHGGHGGMDMGGSKCSMNMIWNTQIIDTCIVFPQWHIASNASFVFSFFVVIGLGIAYEWLRDFQKRVDVRIARALRTGLTNAGPGAVSGASSSSTPSEGDSLLTRPVVKGRKAVTVPFFLRLFRAGLYGATIFLSFFLMLVFMTYNAYLILAVVLGAAFGHFIFTSQMDPEAILSGGGGSGKGMACH